MTDAELSAWADAHGPLDPTLAVAIRRLLDERDAARAVVLGLAERVYLQSELLTKRAERKEWKARGPRAVPPVDFLPGIN